MARGRVGTIDFWVNFRYLIAGGSPGAFYPIMLAFETIRGTVASRGASFLDQRQKDKIKVEFRKAEEYLNAAELLQKNGLYTPVVMNCFYSSMHAATAAFLTIGSPNPQREQYTSFTNALKRFSAKLDPFIEKFYNNQKAWAVNAALEYTENESLLRVYQTRDFLLEVKDFLRRSVRS